MELRNVTYQIPSSINQHKKREKEQRAMGVEFLAKVSIMNFNKC